MKTIRENKQFTDIVFPIPLEPTIRQMAEERSVKIKYHYHVSRDCVMVFWKKDAIRMKDIFKLIETYDAIHPR